MRIFYTGPFESIRVGIAGQPEVRRGEAIEVPDSVAAELLDRDHWTAEETTSRKPKKRGGEE